MLNLTPDLFSYKMFTSPQTKITEDDLCNALKIYQDFWTKSDLKASIKKVGLTIKVINSLYNNRNPLTTSFTNSNDESEFIILHPTDFDVNLLIPQEYQLISYSKLGSIIFTATPVNIRKRYINKQTVELYLSILKRHPSTTQSRILIKYLKQLLKDN